jgi:hypothetical protein
MEKKMFFFWKKKEIQKMVFSENSKTKERSFKKSNTKMRIFFKTFREKKKFQIYKIFFLFF